MSYDERYDEPSIRSLANGNAYAVEHLIEPLLDKRFTALDVGCGTCRKLISLAAKVDRYIALDANETMIAKAVTNLRKYNIHNIFPVVSNAFFLPAENGSIDTVSCMLAPYSITEMHRVLKDDGHLFMEMLGAEDKRELKLHFGKDSLGWRGMLLNTGNAERKDYFMAALNPFFCDIHIQHYKWDTVISAAGLKTLLQLTPTIRDFDLKKDEVLIEKLRNSNNGVAFTEHRMIITAKKKKL